MTGQFIWPKRPAVVERARSNISYLCDATSQAELARLMDAMDTLMTGEKRAAVLMAMASKLGMIAAQCTEGQPVTVDTFAPIAIAIQLAWQRSISDGSAAEASLKSALMVAGSATRN